MAQKDPCSNDEVTTVGGEGGESGEGSGKVVERLVDTNGAQQMVVSLTVTDLSPVGAEGRERKEEESKEVAEKLVDTNGVQQMVVDGIDGTNGSQKWVVPLIFINQRPVAWDEVIKLPQKYKVYKDFIMKNVPVLFRGGSENNAVSTHLIITGPS